jgi:hypothetical protein
MHSSNERRSRMSMAALLPSSPTSAKARALRPPGRMTRTHPKAQIEAIAKSMQTFGVMTPVITDEKRVIRAGIARWHASQLLRLKLIPVIRVTHLSETEFRAFQLADNKLSESAGWDREALAIELEELQVALPEIGLDLSDTGFEPDEIDAVMLDFQEDAPLGDAQALELAQGPAVSRRGDTWKLGGHRLRIDDARDPRAFEQSLNPTRRSSSGAIVIMFAAPAICFMPNGSRGRCLNGIGRCSGLIRSRRNSSRSPFRPAET